jgi:exopolysaccharide biosynthesis predicted pyruvyltransferase EpsI/glycosyltransferase involved in cell wall biosynthesis
MGVNMKNKSMNQMEDKISVIVPVYKVEQYLRKCIDSIIAQTYKNLEIILVEDGSPDNCAQICEQYAASDPRIKVIHKRNGGLSEARNYGIEQATGDYIGFVDSDDWIEKDMYELLHAKAIQYQADIAICGYYFVNKAMHSSYTVNSDTVFTREEALYELAKDKIITNYAWNKLYKRELFARVRYPVGYIYEDMATTYKLFALAERIVAVKDCKYYYLSRPYSITSIDSFKSRYDNFYARYLQYYDLPEGANRERKIYYDLLIKAAVFAYCFRPKGNYYTGNKKKILLTTLKSLYQEEEFREIDIIYQIVVALIIKVRYLGSALFNLGHRYKNYARLLYYIREFYQHIHNRMIYKTACHRTSKPVIYLIGTPEHHNLGDHAIAYAEYQYLSSKFPDYTIQELSDQYLIFRLRMIKRFIQKTDIIVYHGGGNIGNQYLSYEKQRRWVIRNFPENQIIIFPQTVYFTKDHKGRKQFRISKRIYQRHKNLTIAAREQYSYEILKNDFKLNTILTPDIVLYLDSKESKQNRQGALMCLRDDVESQLTKENADTIQQCLEKYYTQVIKTDTYVEVNIPIQDRAFSLESKWFQFRQAELVVTDRIHGMIFAALTGTPCIALSNYNYKIKGSYKWLEHLSYIKYIDHLSELENSILSLREIPEEKLRYDNKQLEAYFNLLAHRIKAASGDREKEETDFAYGFHV